MRCGCSNGEAVEIGCRNPGVYAVEKSEHCEQGGTSNEIHVHWFELGVIS